MENTKNDAVSCAESQPSQENQDGVGTQAKIPDGGEDVSWAMCESETEKGLRETKPSPHSKKVMKHALRQQAKRRRKNTTIAAGNPAPIQRHALSPTTCDIEEVNCDTACYRQPTMAEVLSSIPGFSVKHRKRSQKKLSAAAQLEQTKDGCVDLETPDSILANSNLRSLLNKHTFTSLPALYQYKLLQLLPHVDRTGNDSVFRLSGSGLNNEFFSRACLDWRDRLSEGEFTPENQAKIKAEQEKEKSKLDPWKLKHFEPTWGESLREWPSHPVSSLMTTVPMQTKHRAAKAVPAVTRLRTVGAVTRAVTSYREKRAALSPPRQVNVKRNREEDYEKLENSKDPKDISINDLNHEHIAVEESKTEINEPLIANTIENESQLNNTDDVDNSRKDFFMQDNANENYSIENEHLSTDAEAHLVEDSMEMRKDNVINESLEINQEDMTHSDHVSDDRTISPVQPSGPALFEPSEDDNRGKEPEPEPITPSNGLNDIDLSDSVAYENNSEFSESHNLSNVETKTVLGQVEEDKIHKQLEQSLHDIQHHEQLSIQVQQANEPTSPFPSVENDQSSTFSNQQIIQAESVQEQIEHSDNIQQFIDHHGNINHHIEKSSVASPQIHTQSIQQPQVLHHDIQPQLLQQQMHSAELLQHQLEQPQLHQQHIQQPQLLQQIDQSHHLQQFGQSQLIHGEHSHLLQQQIEQPQFLQQLEQPQLLQQIETLHQQMEHNGNHQQQIEQPQVLQQVEPMLKSNVLMMPQVVLDVQQASNGSVKSGMGHCLTQQQNVPEPETSKQNSLNEMNTVITIPVSNEQPLSDLRVVNDSVMTNVSMLNDVILSDNRVSNNQIITGRRNAEEKWEVIQVNPGEKESLYFKEDEAAILAAAWDVVGTSSHFQDLQEPVSVIPCQEELEVRLQESSLPAPQWVDYSASSDKQSSGHVKLELEVTLTPEVDSQVSSSSAEGTSEPVRVIPPTTIVCLPPLTASAPPLPPPSASSSALPYIALTTSTPVRAVATKPLQTKSGGGRGGRGGSTKPPPGAVNLERSYQICQAVIQNSPNRHQLRCQLKPPPPLLGKRLHQQPPPPRQKPRPQAVFLRHMITSNSGGIPVNMAVLPSHPSHVGGVRRSNSAPPSNSESPACGARGRPASVGGPGLSCGCSLRPLVPCRRCGYFCHEDCITPARICITCHSA